MANYANLKSAVANVIKTNGNQEITGAVLQSTLNNIISVIGDKYTFAGVATPSTNPGSPDQNVVYLAGTAGTYSNFNGLTVAAGEIAVFLYKGTWSKQKVYDDNKVVQVTGTSTTNVMSQKAASELYLAGMGITCSTDNTLNIVANYLLDFSATRLTDAENLKNLAISNIGLNGNTFYLVVVTADNFRGIASLQISKDDYLSAGDVYVGVIDTSFVHIDVAIRVSESFGYFADTAALRAIKVKSKNTHEKNIIFSHYNTNSSFETGIVAMTKRLDIFIPEEIFNKYEYFSISSLGYLASSRGIYVGIAGFDGTNSTVFWGNIVEKINTVPTGIRPLEFIDDINNIKICALINWDLYPGWYNNIDSALKIKPMVFMQNTTAVDPSDVTAQKIKLNLFDISKIELYKRLNSGNKFDDGERYICNRIDIDSRKLYKSNYPFTYLNFYDDNGFISGTAVEGQYLIEPPASATYVIPSGLISQTNFELMEIQEIESIEDEIAGSFSFIQNDMYLSSGDIAKAAIFGYFKKLFSVGVNINDGLLINIPRINQNSALAIPQLFEYDGLINSISVNIESDSNYVLYFGIGSIDQRNWALISRNFNIGVVKGSKKIKPNSAQRIKKGERIFILGVDGVGDNAKIRASEFGYHLERGQDGYTMNKVSGALGIKFEVYGKQYLNASVLNNDIELINQQISNLETSLISKTIPDFPIISQEGNVYKIQVDNQGVLSTIEVPSVGKILIMGNSYDVHGASIGPNAVWWGDFGMAASRRENDWKNTVIRRLRIEGNIIASFNKQSLAGWETKYPYTNFDYSTLDAAFINNSYVLIVIRIGENNQGHTEYSDSYNKVIALINYIKSKSNAPILFGGCLKHGIANNQAYRDAINTFEDIIYMDMEPAGLVMPFAAGLDYQVFGDDGVWHTISESSQAAAVAGHPNDKVMAKMADIIYPYVYDKLKNI